MGNQYLSLSLFLMLLSFFIVLVAMSNFDVSKAKPVLNSLSLAFSSDDLPVDLEPSSVEGTEDISRDGGDSLDKIEGLFRAQIAGADISKNALGTAMHVRMDVKDFENSITTIKDMSDNNVTDMSLIAGKKVSFLKTLVSLMQLSKSQSYRVDIISNIGGKPSALYNKNRSLMQKQVTTSSGYAETLERAGLPRKLVTTGLGAGQKDTVDLFFQRYEVFNPLGLSRSSSRQNGGA